jgi:putative ABC transport system permease protein
MKAAQFQIENLLRLRHKITDEDDFTVRNQKDLMNTLGQITGALTLVLAATAAISLFVGGIGIMNIMLVSVTERTQEIGLRKAIGASQQDILAQFIIEAVILSAAGGLLGTVIGVGGVFLVAAVTPLSAGVSPVAITIAVSVSGGIGLFFGVIPARRAAKLDPIVALRSA